MNTLSKTSEPEFWLQGPLPDIPALLQPAAHALLQSRRELQAYTKDFSPSLLWEKPSGRASVGFHIQHMTGVVDRMLTYASGKSLSDTQFSYLKNEGVSKGEISSIELVDKFKEQVDIALQYFQEIPESSLTEKRTVGRKKLPSTVIGLLFHAAEHSQRHIGQLLVTISILEHCKNY
tara:strand:- start:11308 stop:11838 length:531 start_codon:yes stop_codon:yes gene_type:complete